MKQIVGFQRGTTNTIDDVTGFKEKSSTQVRRWDGVYTTAEQSEPRQPQDFPPIIRPVHVDKNARPPRVEVESFPPITIY